jgi:hypothetical protein
LIVMDLERYQWHFGQSRGLPGGSQRLFQLEHIRVQHYNKMGIGV